MFLSRRRLILVGAIAAIVVIIVLLPSILTITLPANVNSVNINLSKVQLVNPNIANDSRTIELNVYFNIYNPTQQVLTTSRIEYQLFANGTPLGSGILSYEDIPLNGRPQLYYNSTTPLKSSFEITYSNTSAPIIKLLSNLQTAKQIKWRAIGEAQIESGFSSLPKKFNSEL
jgi:LEA14-like dessication related protein